MILKFNHFYIFHVQYNPPEHEVVAMAKRLSEVFDKKMIDAFSGTAESDHESSSDFGDSDSDDERTRKLQAIQKKVNFKSFENSKILGQKSKF